MENMHEAIVTHEEFQKVQEILKLGRKRGSHGIQEYPLKGVGPMCRVPSDNDSPDWQKRRCILSM